MNKKLKEFWSVEVITSSRSKEKAKVIDNQLAILKSMQKAVADKMEEGDLSVEELEVLTRTLSNLDRGSSMIHMNQHETTCQLCICETKKDALNMCEKLEEETGKKHIVAEFPVTVNGYLDAYPDYSYSSLKDNQGESALIVLSSDGSIIVRDFKEDV